MLPAPLFQPIEVGKGQMMVNRRATKECGRGAHEAQREIVSEDSPYGMQGEEEKN
jgi:hypothetical protein